MHISIDDHLQGELLERADDMSLTFSVIISSSDIHQPIWPILRPQLLKHMQENYIFFSDPPGPRPYRDEERITMLMCLQASRRGGRGGRGPIVQFPTGSIDTFIVEDVKKWAKKYTAVGTDQTMGLIRYLVFLGTWHID